MKVAFGGRKEKKTFSLLGPNSAMSQKPKTLSDLRTHLPKGPGHPEALTPTSGMMLPKVFLRI